MRSLTLPFLPRGTRLQPVRAGFGGLVLAALLVMLAVSAPRIARAQPAPGGAAQPTVTILDGSAVLLRGAGKLQLAEGVRLAAQDIVETATDARLLRIEFPDGQALSLGPATRLLIDPRLAGEKGRTAQVYLLRGWVKLNAAPKPGAQAPIASPLVDLLSSNGSVVASVQEATLQVFVETGEASLQERQAGGAIGGPQKLRGGEFLARTGSAKSGIVARAPADFVAQMPRSFLDTLPARAALYKDRDITPKPLADISYADAQAWLSAEPSLRRPAMPRWRPLARNPAFRDGIVTHMPAHPEWDRVLFPEKYLPKPAYPGATAPAR